MRILPGSVHVCGRLLGVYVRGRRPGASRSAWPGQRLALGASRGRGGSLAIASLRRGARGRVVSAYARAVNLLLDDGVLVGLLPAGTPVHPWALAVDADLTRLAPDMAIRCQAGSLYLGLPPGEMVIELDALEPCLLTLRARPAAAPTAGLEPTPALETEIERTLEAFGRGETSALVDLVGVGEGLTPSGDDVLVGLLAALDLLSLCAPASAVRRCSVVEGVRPRLALGTTRLAAELVSAACDGHYAEPILALLEALAHGAPEPLAIAVPSVAAMGHRSGHAVLRGLVAGLTPSCRGSSLRHDRVSAWPA